MRIIENLILEIIFANNISLAVQEIMANVDHVELALFSTFDHHSLSSFPPLGDWRITRCCRRRPTCLMGSPPAHHYFDPAQIDADFDNG